VSGQRRASLPGVEELFRTTGPRPVPTPVAEVIAEDPATDTRVLTPEATKPAQLIAWVAGFAEARQVVDVGPPERTVALSLAEAMPDGGTITLVTEDTAGLASTRKIVEARASQHRVRTIPGDPADVLGRLSDGTYDLVVLRADAARDRPTRDQAVRLLRRGGVIVLGDGTGQDAPVRDVAEDPRLDVVAVPFESAVGLGRVR
jgi:predicted O-methyltransferase YrrM